MTCHIGHGIPIQGQKEVYTPAQAEDFILAQEAAHIRVLEVAPILDQVVVHTPVPVEGFILVPGAVCTRGQEVGCILGQVEGCIPGRVVDFILVLVEDYMPDLLPISGTGPLGM